MHWLSAIITIALNIIRGKGGSVIVSSLVNNWRNHDWASYSLVFMSGFLFPSTSEGNTWCSVVFVVYLYSLLIYTFPWYLLSSSPPFVLKSGAPISSVHLCLALQGESLLSSSLFIYHLFSCASHSAHSSNFLHLGPASTACWRLAQWVGGSCMRGTLWATCCGLRSPLNLCSVSLQSLHFSFFLPFSLSSCGEGKSYSVVYLFCFGVGSHMSLAGFYTSMTVAWIVRDYHAHTGIPLAILHHYLPGGSKTYGYSFMCAVQPFIVNAGAKCLAASAFPCHSALVSSI